MDILYIFVITIVLSAGTGSVIEDTKTDKDQQRILLRKLQNFQETKPETWNEILADVLVNKIRIFSFTNQDKENTTTTDAPVSKTNTILTNFFSKVFVVYKTLIYDAFVVKPTTTNNDESVHLTTVDPRNVDVIPKKIPEDVIKPTEVIVAEGPKSEVELIEPRYHGKITFEETTQLTGINTTEPTQRDDTVSDIITTADTKPNLQESVEPQIQGNLDSKLESAVNCAEGSIKGDSSNCAKDVSRLIMAVPNQCPNGYKKDWLGFCRKLFKF